jgi:hypothetical protein
MKKLTTHFRSLGPKAGLVLGLSLVLVAGAAMAQTFTEPTQTAPNGNVTSVVDTSATTQTKSGDFWANTIGTTNGFCIGASCISAWPTLPTCAAGVPLVYSSTGVLQCAQTFSVTEPGACNGGFCQPTAPVAQELCASHSLNNVFSYQTAYANNSQSTKFCSDFNFSNSTWSCDGSCSNSCHDAISTVTCY